MSDPNADGPKISIDSDWKAQARAEKERLAEKAKTAESKPGGRPGPGGMPPANFESLVSIVATQSLAMLGAFPDPRTGQRVANLDGARYFIDLLTVLEEKTKGNLKEEEANMLATTIYELRQRYIQISSSSRTT